MRNFFFVIVLSIFKFSTGFSAVEGDKDLREKLNELNTIGNIDSLLNARLGFMELVKNSDFALYLEVATENIELAKKNNLSWAQIDNYMELGETFIKKGNFGIALNYLNQALKLSLYDEYKPYIGWVTLEIGNAYEGMQSFDRANDYYFRALEFFRESGENEGIALAASNIGNSYLANKDFSNAKKYLELGLEERKKLNNPVETGYVQLFLARLYISTGEFELAKDSLQKNIAFLKDFVIARSDGIQLINATHLVGDLLCMLAESVDSLGLGIQKYNHLFEAKKIFAQLNDTLNVSMVFNLISQNYLNDKNYEKAILHADSARNITQGVTILNQQAIANRILSEVYTKLQNYRLALKYYIDYTSVSNLMFNQSVTNAISDVDVFVNSIIKNRDNQILLLEIAHERKIKILVSVGLSLIVILFGILLFNIFIRYRKGKQVNNELRVKNQEIMFQRQKLETLNDELNLLIKSKDKFHSIIAHDLRNPVSSINSVCELLSSSFDELPESTRMELIHLSAQNSGKTLKLLDNLLTWSRLQGGHLKLRTSRFELNIVIEDILNDLKYIAEHKSINVTYKKSEVLYINADREMISTIIRNLFTNAVKYTPNNKNVTLGFHRHDEKVEIWVEDEGIGISKDRLDKLFLIDSDIQTPGTNKESGTGLGLQLSNEFVKLHNGYFDIISEESKGSRFAFFIPLNKQGQ